MPLRIEFSDRAEQELDEIVSYLVRNAPKAALSFGDAFDRATARLSLFPESGLDLRDGRRLTLVGATGYSVIYEASGDAVVVASIHFGGRRDR